MATLASVMAALKAKGSEKARVTYARHGLPLERTLGVSVADMKVIAKGIKKQQALAMELYATGVMEAMYLAGMVADGGLMSRAQLQAWAEGSGGMSMIAEHTVPWVAVESAEARALAMEWVQSKEGTVRVPGWCTYSGLVATKEDAVLDLKEIRGLMKTVEKQIGAAPNRVKYVMNGFVICVGTYVLPLLGEAKAAAARMGTVEVDVGDTACKVPLATEYIAKVESMGRLGLKRKTIRC